MYPLEGVSGDIRDLILIVDIHAIFFISSSSLKAYYCQDVSVKFDEAFRVAWGKEPCNKRWLVISIIKLSNLRILFSLSLSYPHS